MALLAPAAVAQLPDPNDPRVGLSRPARTKPGVAKPGHGPHRPSEQAARICKSTRRTPDPDSGSRTATWRSRATTRSWGTSTASTSTTSRTRGAEPAHVRGVPRRAGRPLGVRQPAVHVGGGAPRQDRLHADPGGDCRDPLPRRPDLRHLEPRSPRRSAASRPVAGPTPTPSSPTGDRPNVYIYVQGTAGVRPPAELAGCDGLEHGPPTGRTTRRGGGSRSSRCRSPRRRTPRSSTGRGCSATRHRRRRRTPERPPDAQPPIGNRLEPTPITDACHDITVYPELEIAAGACEGNGLLIDISDPANPMRIDAVADPLYAYWHGATFSNDGKTVVFTDEWGGGTGARCRANDDLKLGRQLDLRHRATGSSCSAATTRSRRSRRPGELRQPHPVAGPGSGP